MKARNKISQGKGTGGFALMLVLAMLVLISVAAISFFSNVTTELKATKAYADSVESSRLSDAAVNLVMAEISAATSAGSIDAPVSWASQPGMIRTWDSNGQLNGIYKLYSWSNLIEVAPSGGGVLNYDPYAASELPPATWDGDTAHYVDLNEPLNGVYPILDPSAESIVEGFELDENDQALSGKQNPAAMPVQWLYMLEDGTLVSPDNSSGTRATIASATSDNPIISRIAFWTDDETAKVNLNTASEMVFWEAPRTNYEEERGSEQNANPYWPGFDTAVPIDQEFQRYPGHPATTSLSPILGSVMPRADYIANDAEAEALDKYYRLAPRIAPGGTMGGTRAVFTGRNNFEDHIPAMELDADRLFASTDELLFGPGDPSLAGQGRQSQDQESYLNTPGLTADFIAQTKFFLTTASRAPDENLFNLPRISLWPLQDDSAQNGVRNAKDELLAFAATLGGNPYYFQRHEAYQANGIISGADSSQSPTEDYQAIERNQELLENYLLQLTQLDIPGFGNSFENKYGADNTQILVQFFDFIRSNVNTNSQSLEPRYSYAPTDPDDMKDVRGFNSVAPTRVSINGTDYQGFGRTRFIPDISIVFMATQFKDETDLRTVLVDHDLDSNTPDIEVPTWDGTTPITQARPSEANGDGLPDDEPAGPMEDPFELDETGVDFVALPAEQWAAGAEFDGVGDPRVKAIQAFLILRLDSVSPGAPMFNPALRVQIEGLSSLQIGYEGNNYNLGFPEAAQAVALSSPTTDHSLMPRAGTSTLLRYHKPGDGSRGREIGPTTGVAEGHRRTDDGTRLYPFAGAEVAFVEPAPPSRHAIPEPDVEGGWEQAESDDTEEMLGGRQELVRPSMRIDQFTFNGGNIRVKIMNGYEENPDLSDDDYLYQSYDIELPLKTLPLPEIVRERPSLNGPWLRGSSLNPENEGGIRTLGFYTGVPSNLQNKLDPMDLSIRFGGYVPQPGVEINHPGVSHPEKDEMQRYWQSRLDGPQTYGRWGAEVVNELVRLGDIVVTVGLDPNGPSGGDPRLMAARSGLPASSNGDNWFEDLDDGNRQYRHSARSDNWSVYNPQRQSHAFTWIEPDGNDQSKGMGYWDPGNGVSTPYDLENSNRERLTGTLVPESGSSDYLDYTRENTPNAVLGLEGAKNKDGAPGDWDTGVGGAIDGPYINKAEEGFAGPAQSQYWSIYFPANDVSLSGTDDRNAVISALSYSPTRQIPSAVQFGSLPTGVQSLNPWTTLLFSPNPAAKSAHTGFVDPPDHLYLDLFTMPVPEPYAISEPFSTAGRVNLNYTIQPFPYIKRATGIHALMRDVKIAAIHDSLRDYKNKVDFEGKQSIRYGVDVDKTLVGFNRILDPARSDQPSNNPDLFRSASQICEIFLVPRLNAGLFEYENATSNVPATYAATADWWDDYRRTGDNLRENPYNQLYSRVTTKSNTYTVHWRVQSLKKVQGTSADEWVEGVDRVESERRGSTTIERYIDPNATDIPDYATELANDPDPLHEFYRWRVVADRKFNP